MTATPPHLNGEVGLRYTTDNCYTPVRISGEAGMAILTRRAAMAGLAGSALGACHSPIDPIDPSDPKLTDASTPFTCDVHSHVFNGADLQIERLFNDVIALDTPELR